MALLRDAALDTFLATGTWGRYDVRDEGESALEVEVWRQDGEYGGRWYVPFDDPAAGARAVGVAVPAPAPAEGARRTLKLEFEMNPRHVHVDVRSGTDGANLALCGHLVLDHEDWEALRGALVAGHDVPRSKNYTLLFEEVSRF